VQDYRLSIVYEVQVLRSARQRVSRNLNGHSCASLVVQYTASQLTKEWNFTSIQCIRFNNTMSAVYLKYFIKDLPSRYALIVKYPISKISPKNITQERNFDHENIKCSTNIAENSNDDCQAWNLSNISTMLASTSASTF
jgi:hypothetical protein